MILNMSLPQNEPLLGFSLKPPKWARQAAGAVVHSAAVNLAVVKKDVVKPVQKALTPGRDVRRAAAAVGMVAFGPVVGAIAATKILTKSDVSAVKKAVTVNSANLVKSVKKISMNKIVDSLTPDVVLPVEEESGIKKLLPLIAAGGAGLLFLL